MRSTRIKIEEKAKKKKLSDIEASFRGIKKSVPTPRKQSKSKFVLRPDIGYTVLQNLRYGRFSFNGANPDIAKIQSEEDAPKKQLSDTEVEEEGDDDVFCNWRSVMYLSVETGFEIVHCFE